MNSSSQEEPIYEPALLTGAIRQGEIITELTQYIVRSTTSSKELEVDVVGHPYAIVVSQDCDLDWDYKARQGLTGVQKLLPNMLFCMVVTAEELKGGEEMNPKTWSNVRINKSERFQFLQRVLSSEDAHSEGLPELGVDFKRYFTLTTQEAYQAIENNTARRRCHLRSPYLEHFNSRFHYFQGRIALPSEHMSEPNQ